jgi:hypothetical protein
MVDGNEFGSIVALRPASDDLVPELRRAIAVVEQIRGRRCVCYVGNVVKDLKDPAETAIRPGDHLPFNEMIGQVPSTITEVDLFLVTPGGVAEQVTQFVDALRGRFASVEFILPYKCMSAGTLWALSGERIWMDRRAFVGPVDPQVPSKDGNLVPAQALLRLLNAIQQAGDKALAQKQSPPWAMIRLLDQMDQKQLGHAINSTEYVINLASEYLEKYKFKHWTTRSSTGQPVTPEERKARARQVATDICNHERWKAHGHAINRDAAFAELKIKVDKVEDTPGLERAVRRLWALFYYVLDRSDAAKIMLSQEYAFVRNVVQIVVQKPGGN